MKILRIVLAFWSVGIACHAQPESPVTTPEVGDAPTIPEGFESEAEFEKWARQSSFGGGYARSVAPDIFYVIRGFTSGVPTSEVTVFLKKGNSYKLALVVPTRRRECEIKVEEGFLKIRYRMEGEYVELVSMKLDALRALPPETTSKPATGKDDKRLPPPDLRAEWRGLEEKGFSAWSIREFNGWAEPFDGGSKVFSFVMENGERISVVVANPGYWTEAERKAGRQVFFVTHDKFFHHVDPGSDGEKQLVAMLEQAAERLKGTGDTDPKLVKGLAERLKSREPLFKTGP